jgi:hypothetical protein
MMNPNSAHQMWSRWTFTVVARRPRTIKDISANVARFGRKAFGSATAMRARPLVSDARGAVAWEFDIRTEGHPVHDVAYVTWMTAQWRRFFLEGFGVGTTVTCETRLEAGSRQDGTPSDQLIILPSIAIEGAKA